MTEEEKRQKALDAIRRGIAAQVEEDYKPQLDRLETKAENKIKNTTGLDPETAAKAAALLKMAADASQGRFEQEIGGLKIDAEITPEEKKIMLKKSWSF